jgi:hypothetical protein
MGQQTSREQDLLNSIDGFVLARDAHLVTRKRDGVIP